MVARPGCRSPLPCPYVHLAGGRAQRHIPIDFRLPLRRLRERGPQRTQPGFDPRDERHRHAHLARATGRGERRRPRGVVVLGDCIDDGDRMLDGKPQTKPQYEFFRADFGLDGTDGLLKFPVFEGWGNHDGPPVGKERFGFSFQAELKKRNAIRQQKGRIGNLSENGLHYSWDWDDVHLVQLNFYPADQQRAGVRYSPVWHDPQGR